MGTTMNKLLYLGLFTGVLVALTSGAPQSDEWSLEDPSETRAVRAAGPKKNDGNNNRKGKKVKKTKKSKGKTRGVSYVKLTNVKKVQNTFSKAKKSKGKKSKAKSKKVS